MGDLRGTLFNITKNVSKTSGDLIKTTKISVDMAGEEETLKSIYIDIGKKVHEIYMYGGSLGKFFDEKYLEIERSEAKIADYKEKLHQIRGTRGCPKCGKSVEKAAGFCPKCGTNMDTGAAVDPVKASENPSPPSPQAEEPEAPPAPLPEIPNVPEPPPRKVCGVCGEANEANTKFCLFCGRLI